VLLWAELLMAAFCTGADDERNFIVGYFGFAGDSVIGRHKEGGAP